MKELSALSYEELRAALKLVNVFAEPVLDTFPKQRTRVDEVRLAFCRRMWIEIHNQLCVVLAREAQVRRGGKA